MDSDNTDIKLKLKFIFSKILFGLVLIVMLSILGITIYITSQMQSSPTSSPSREFVLFLGIYGMPFIVVWLIIAAIISTIMGVSKSDVIQLTMKSSFVKSPFIIWLAWIVSTMLTILLNFNLEDILKTISISSYEIVSDRFLEITNGKEFTNVLLVAGIIIAAILIVMLWRAIVLIPLVVLLIVTDLMPKGKFKNKVNNVLYILLREVFDIGVNQETLNMIDKLPPLSFLLIKKNRESATSFEMIVVSNSSDKIWRDLNGDTYRRKYLSQQFVSILEKDKELSIASQYQSKGLIFGIISSDDFNDTFSLLAVGYRNTRCVPFNPKDAQKLDQMFKNQYKFTEYKMTTIANKSISNDNERNDY